VPVGMAGTSPAMTGFTTARRATDGRTDWPARD